MSQPGVDYRRAQVWIEHHAPDTPHILHPTPLPPMPLVLNLTLVILGILHTHTYSPLRCSTRRWCSWEGRSSTSATPTSS